MTLRTASAADRDDLTARDLTRRRVATVVGLLVGCGAHLLNLLGGGFGRTANALGYASNFFDVQGRAFLDGDLHVPRGSLGIEGFIQDGLEYTYFGPWPALLRLPILSTTTQYDGRLTVASMLLAFVLLVVMTTRLVWLVRDLVCGSQPVGRLEAAAAGLLLALAVGGTSLTYVAALPWVYHEVYAWAVAFAVGALYWMLRMLQVPSRGHLLALTGFGLGAILTRTTSGWAVALGTIAMGLWLLLRRDRTTRRPRWGAALLGSGAGVLLAGIAVNWAKFRHPFMFPLEDQVWTTENSHRAEALAVNGGTITGPDFFPSAFMAYFRPDGIRFTEHFPFVSLPAEPAGSFGGAFLDQSYRTGSVTAFMPWLLLMTILAALVLFRPGVPLPLRWLRFPLVTGVLITGGVMAYGYLAHRYTAEFVPALVVGGAVGTFSCVAWLRERPRWPSTVFLSAMALLTAHSILASTLIGYTATAQVHGGEPLVRLLDTQQRLTPGAQARLVTLSDDLPTGGRADDLWITGDCESLYVNSGDQYDEWLLVERRSAVVQVSLSRRARPGRIQLIRTDAESRGSVWLEIGRGSRARVQIVDRTGTYSGTWFDVVPPRQIRVGLRDLSGLDHGEVSSDPGGFTGMIRTFDWGPDWVSRPTGIEGLVPPERRQRALGVRVRVEPGLPLPTCERIRDNAEARHASR